MKRMSAIALLVCVTNSLALAQESQDSIPRIVQEADRLDAALTQVVDGWASERLHELAFGMPTQSTCERATQENAAALERVRTARQALAQQLRAIEQAGGLENPIERDAISRALLVEAVSLPLLEARAQLAIGLARDATFGRAPSGAAAEALKASIAIADHVESASPWADAERGLIVGIGLTALGDFAPAQRALDDAEDALREDAALAAPAYGLVRALSLAEAALAFHREPDTSKATNAAQRRLRRADGVDEAQGSALSMRLLVARAGDVGDAQAQTFLAARLDEIARVALIDAHASDEVVLAQLARVGDVVSMEGGSRWALGSAVGVALVIRDAPEAPARQRVEELTSALERDREAMGPYSVIALSALAEALDRCVQEDACSFDLALHVAQRAVEARPLHDHTRSVLDRLCRTAIAGGGPLAASTSSALHTLIRHTPDAEQRDLWCCQAILRVVEASPSDDAEALLHAIDQSDSFVDMITFRAPAANDTLLYVCRRLAAAIERLEQSSVEGVLLGEQQETLARLAAQLMRISEHMEEARIGEQALAEARALRAHGLLALGEHAHALELTRTIVDDSSATIPLKADVMHARALLANRRINEAKAWAERARTGEATGALLHAALVQTRALWASGPELTRSLDEASIGALSDEDRRALALVMAWTVEQSEAWVVPEHALRRGIGWLIAADDGAAEQLAASLLAQPAGDARVMRERTVLAAEARLHAGDDAGAFAVLRSFVSSTPPEARRERAYWHASVRMLQILVRQNQGGARTPTIVREIQRLQLQPTWDAHPDCRREIEQIASQLGMDSQRAPEGP